MLWQGTPVRLAQPDRGAEAGHRDHLPGARPRRRALRRRQHPLGHENATGGFVHRRDQVANTPPAARPAGPPRDPSRPARWAGCRPPRSRSSAWRAPSRRTPGSSSWTSRPPSSRTTRSSNLFRRHPRPHRGRRRRRLHLPPARGDPPRSATGSPCSRTAVPSPPACRPAAPPPRDVVRLMTGRTIEYVFPPRRTGTRGRPARRGAAGRGPRAARELPRRRPSRCARARSSASPAWSGSGRSEILETIYGARRRTARHGRGRRPRAAARADVGAAVARRARRSRPRSARARPCCWTSRPPQHLARDAWPGSPGSASSTGAAERGRRARAGASPRRAARRPEPRRSARCPAATSRRSCSPGGCSRDCRVLLLDEPTRGVDVGARSEIYAAHPPARRPRRRPSSLVSSEIPEVLGLADRVLVLREGARRPRGTGRRARRAPGARPGHGRKRRMSGDAVTGPARAARAGRHARAGERSTSDRGRRGGRSGEPGCVGRWPAVAAATSAWSSRWSLLLHRRRRHGRHRSPTSTTC